MWLNGRANSATLDADQRLAMRDFIREQQLVCASHDRLRSPTNQEGRDEFSRPNRRQARRRNPAGRRSEEVLRSPSRLYLSPILSARRGLKNFNARDIRKIGVRGEHVFIALGIPGRLRGRSMVDEYLWVLSNGLCCGPSLGG
jgi:hypothetical protein